MVITHTKHFLRIYQFWLFFFFSLNYRHVTFKEILYERHVSNKRFSCVEIDQHRDTVQQKLRKITTNGRKNR